jgi:hypothetical protein
MQTTNLKDGIKPQTKDPNRRDISFSHRENGRNRTDIDSTLAGKKAVLYVQAGNNVAPITGIITIIGQYWVVVKVEKAPLPFAGSNVMYINKAHIIAYTPIQEGGAL